MGTNKLYLSLVALVFASCSSTSDKSAGPAYEEGISAHVEITSVLAPREQPDSSAVVRLTEADLRKRGTRVLPEQSAEALPGFLRDVESRLTARWEGEREIVSASPEQRREISARRLISFPSAEVARTYFPDLAADQLSEERAQGSVSVLVGEIRYSLLRSLDGGAMRVRLDRLFTRRAAKSMGRLLPAEDKPVPVVLSLTVRYVAGGQEATRLLAFPETIDPTKAEFEAGGALTDWIPIASGVVPHSLEFNLVAWDEVEGILRTMRETGLSIFGLAETAKGLAL